RAFVQNGGSIYASDWAGPLVALAYPARLVLRLSSGGDTTATPVASPFATDTLVGFAPQQVAATIANADLASYMGASSVTISFPSSPPTNHWALLASAPAGVSADITGSAKPCADSACTSAGSPRASVPLTV